MARRNRFEVIIEPDSDTLRRLKRMGYKTYILLDSVTKRDLKKLRKRFKVLDVRF